MWHNWNYISCLRSIFQACLIIKIKLISITCLETQHFICNHTIIFTVLYRDLMYNKVSNMRDGVWYNLLLKFQYFMLNIVDVRIIDGCGRKFPPRMRWHKSSSKTINTVRTIEEHPRKRRGNISSKGRNVSFKRPPMLKSKLVWEKLNLKEFWVANDHYPSPCLTWQLVRETPLR